MLTTAMFCPQCKAEYRPGFTRCSDCEVDLVERLPESIRGPEGDLSLDCLREVWSGNVQDECVSVCEELRAAHIPFRVLQGRSQFLKGVDLTFKVGVPVDFWVEAKRTLEKGCGDLEGDGENQQSIELQARDNPVDAFDSNNVTVVSENWRSENATVQVWEENSPEHIELVELSLRENQIRVRIEASDNGSRRIFVTPNDESRARAILSEIKNETPPP
jgi:hypothetical protein